MAVWTPPAKIEQLYAATAGNQFAAMNRPTAGARETKELPSGDAPIQLYGLGTPNGTKVSIMLEELEALGVTTYDAHTINIGTGAQFTSGFTDVNPNGKIPGIVDKSGPGGAPMPVFESAAIVLYLAEKFQCFIPTDPRLRVEMMSWLFWQMAGQGPMSGACYGHFFAYAPADKCEARDYGVARYGMEVQRLCSVLDNHLAGRAYLVGDEYSIADMVCFPWFNHLRVGYNHSSGVKTVDFLSVSTYSNAIAWADRIAARPAVQRGLQVCPFSGPAKPWLVAKEQE